MLQEESCRQTAELPRRCRVPTYWACVVGLENALDMDAGIQPCAQGVLRHNEMPRVDVDVIVRDLDEGDPGVGGLLAFVAQRDDAVGVSAPRLDRRLIHEGCLAALGEAHSCEPGPALVGMASQDNVLSDRLGLNGRCLLGESHVFAHQRGGEV